MTPDEFNIFLESVLAEERTTLMSKQSEYATEDNRFDNFDKMSKLARGIYCIIDYRSDEYDVLIQLMLKHFYSVLINIQTARRMKHTKYSQDFLNDFQKLLEAKNGDFTNYTVLLRGLLQRDLNYAQESGC